jgi:hypothetical protein
LIFISLVVYYNCPTPWGHGVEMTQAQQKAAITRYGEDVNIDFVANAQYITAHSVVEVLDNSIRVMEEIDKFESRTLTLRWRVRKLLTTQVRSLQRVQIIVFAEAVRAQSTSGVARRYLTQMDSFRKGTDLVERFPERSIEPARRVSAVLNNGVHQMNLRSSEMNVEVNKETLHHIDEANRTRFYHSYGTVEGNLLVLDSSGQKPHFDIIEAATKSQIACYFEDMKIEQQAYNLWKHRVSAVGNIKYNQAGKRISIQVNSLNPLPLESDLPLPTIQSLWGMNITGGVDSVQYIRGLRDNGEPS